MRSHDRWQISRSRTQLGAEGEEEAGAVRVHNTRNIDTFPTHKEEEEEEEEEAAVLVYPVYFAFSDRNSASH